MLAVAGAGAALSSPGSAQPATSAIEIVSATSAGAPVAPDNVGPRVSDDGSIVVFDSSTTIDDPTQPTSTSTVPAVETGVVTIRNRVANTTVSVPDAPSLHPGVSGNGCVIAYSVPTAASQVQLTALNLCDAVGGPLVGSTVVLDTVTGTEALPAPALSEDGSVIVWSTGRTINRYVDAGGGYVGTAIPLPLTTLGTTTAVTGSGVDVSDDGNVVAFVAGPGTVGDEPAPPNVFVWSDADGPGAGVGVTELASATTTGGPGTGASTSPSVSGDGRILVFESSSPDLAASGSATAAVPFVVVHDRSDSTAAVLAGQAFRPAISGDGSVVVYDTPTDVHLQRWVSGTEPFENVSDRSVSIGIDGLPAGPSVTGPAVTRDGGLAVFDHTNGRSLTTDARFHAGAHVWARPTAEEPPPGTTTSTVPSTPTTPTPTTTTPSGGTAPTPPSTATRPSVPPSSSGSPTIPTVPIPSRPNPPSSSSGSRPPSVSGSGSTGGSRPVGTGSTPSFSTGPIEFVSFVPSGVEFSPTIVDAGRQSAGIAVSNPTSAPVTLTGISFEGDTDGAFSVSDNACEGLPIPPGGSCSLTVTYAPVTVGDASVRIVATLSNGSVASGDLVGTGAPPPVVAVVPGVASSGQVVVIQGSGFPIGVSVELSWLGQEPAEVIAVDEVGSFTETQLVMSHTPRGPATLRVFGQADLFDTVVGDVLITDTADRSSSTLTQTAGSRFAS